MEEKFARVISYIFHPIFYPLFCLILLFNIRTAANFDFVWEAQLMILAFVAVTTIIFPLLMIFLMKRQHFIRSYQMESRQERLLPYLITAIFYFLAYNLFCQMQLHSIYISYILGAAFILVVVVLISLRWKVSTHMAGIGGVFGMTISVSFILSVNLMFAIMVIAVVAGIIGFARLRLNTHNPAEVYAGFIVGTIVMMGVYFIPLFLI
jgi:hypothetical protein